MAHVTAPLVAAALLWFVTSGGRGRLVFLSLLAVGGLVAATR